MAGLWQSLVGNLALVALFISVWTHLTRWAMHHSLRVRQCFFGIFMGAAALSSMLMAFELQPGMFFDLRSAVLAIAGLFGGPLATIISGSAAVAFRVHAGGAGVLAGSIGILLSSLAGAICFYALRGRTVRAWHVLVLAVMVIVANIGGFLALPSELVIPALSRVGPHIAGLSFIGTALAGLAILDAQRRGRERDLLLAAVAQAPDFFYIKDVDSQFAAVNQAVAERHGFATPAGIVGVTDFALAPLERAKQLFDAEQELMASGQPLLEFEEELIDTSGQSSWFATSKVPLRNDDGELIGLAGVTRDVTQDKRMRAELEASRNLLSYALAEMSDGLAMFDRKGYLVFSNDRYRDSFPLSGYARQPGAHIDAILRLVVDSGEQMTVPLERTEAWISQTAALLHVESEEEVQLFNGRWLHLRNRPTGDGTCLVVVSDVTTLKEAETELLVATEQLKILATTDGLTGLVNRRAFDEALDLEVSRSLRARAPLSLLLIDVDRFKAYNDLYGHPAGDECLRLVSSSLKNILRRPADLAARYGGEEFAAILPDTDEDGAYFIADQFLKALRHLAIAHQGSEKGIVSVSIGIASYGTGSYRRLSSQLIEKADEALYGAKAAGRDRVNGWHATDQHGSYQKVSLAH